ncbi:MAG TPA: hypothetical protein DCL73_10970 [Treponema sp.]|nr:hypothetical protein [Treponema sp.]
MSELSAAYPAAYMVSAGTGDISASDGFEHDETARIEKMRKILPVTCNLAGDIRFYFTLKTVIYH